MTQKGEHTWDIVIHYYRCPKCGNIIESREAYKYRLGVYGKDVECPRCHHGFRVLKKTKPTFGPLSGEPQPVEFDWSTDK